MDHKQPRSFQLEKQSVRCTAPAVHTFINNSYDNNTDASSRSPASETTNSRGCRDERVRVSAIHITALAVAVGTYTYPSHTGTIDSRPRAGRGAGHPPAPPTLAPADQENHKNLPFHTSASSHHQRNAVT